MTDSSENDAKWRDKLDPETYRVTRQKGTERPFTGKYYLHKESGLYHCVCCEAPLFSSEAKYDTGCGWPSFYEPVSEQALNYIEDHSHGMVRTEITCAQCDAHLGHVFSDGPHPTGQRFCINSVSLNFEDDHR